MPGSGLGVVIGGDTSTATTGPMAGTATPGSGEEAGRSPVIKEIRGLHKLYKVQPSLDKINRSGVSHSRILKVKRNTKRRDHRIAALKKEEQDSTHNQVKK